FAGVVSNDSGCCGASISREKNPSSENLAYIIKTFPHWFVPALDEYIDREAEMPFDQNWFAALTAPRPLLIASATEDTWSDPYNEYRCARAVGEVWNLFGAAGIGSAGFPAPDSPVFGDRVGYYLRTGIHDVTEADWRFVLEFIGKN
ncbi:MAG: acetylxylan esterase, partial [bacterium]|nr:acetylxylan esterase [bacterium]